MKFLVCVLHLILMGLSVSQAHAEILAMLNYETKPEQTMRREGIAVLDVDPESPSFGKMLMDIPLPPDLVAHHIYFNRDKSKAYVTSLGKSALHVMDLTRFPYRMKAVPVPDCRALEDVVFSGDGRTWYLTCMGSSGVVMGDAATDTPIKTIASPVGGAAFIKYPHGISLHSGIDRIMVTSTVRASDLGDPGETVTVLEASSGTVLSTHRVSRKPSPAGEAPVEVMFMPGTDPPVAYITNMFGATLWMAVWDPGTKSFDFSQVDDFASRGHGVPLEIEHNGKHDRLYITTAKPGHVSVFDVSDARKPRFLKAIPAAPGAHHLAFSPDERYLFVQNSFLNLPEMRDGSITVIDMARGEPVASMDTLKNMGLNPNCIVLLPLRP